MNLRRHDACRRAPIADSLNVRGVLAHLVTDIWAFAATLLAGVVVLTTGWTRADPIASLVVAAVMAWTGWRLVRAAGRVFLEAAPAGVDPRVAGRGARADRRRRRGARPARVGDRAAARSRCRRTCSCGRRATATRWRRAAGRAPRAARHRARDAADRSRRRRASIWRPTARRARRVHAARGVPATSVVLALHETASFCGVLDLLIVTLDLVLRELFGLVDALSIWSECSSAKPSALSFNPSRSITPPLTVDIEPSPDRGRLAPCWCRCRLRARCSCSPRRASIRCTSAACSCSSRRTGRRPRT